MVEEQKPVGQLHSRVYLQPSETARDSQKMRMRVLRTILRIVPEGQRDIRFGAVVEELLGIEFVSSGVGYGSSHVNWNVLIRKRLSINDLLDVLTLLWRNLKEHRGRQEEFRKAISSIFAQEAIGFSIDERMGFHPAFDGEFERSRGSIVQILSGECFPHEADFIAKSETALLADPVDGRAAIRAVYDAVENLFKRLTGKQNINNGHVRQELVPIALMGVPEDGKSDVAVKKMLAAFEDWVAACHVYRHAPGEAETAQPSFEIAILIVSQGYGFVRWLAEMVAE